MNLKPAHDLGIQQKSSKKKRDQNSGSNLTKTKIADRMRLKPFHGLGCNTKIKGKKNEIKIPTTLGERRSPVIQKTKKKKTEMRYTLIHLS